MILMPKDYDSAKAYAGQGFETLPIGPHICKIISAKLEQARSGADMLVVAFDVAESGPYDGFYKTQHEYRKGFNAEAKWLGIFRTNILTREGKTSGYFKGFITSVEESNPGYNFRAANGDENTLKGKTVAFNFGEEEWRKSDGSVGVSVKPFYAVSIKTAREGIEPPPRKALNDGQAQMQRQGFKPVDDDDLPF